MNAITGEVVVTARGETYRLCLGMIGLAQLQKEYGQHLGPITDLDLKEGELPDFSVMVRVVDLALDRYHPEHDKWVADDILREDLSTFLRLVEGAFPEPDPEVVAAVEARTKAAEKGRKSAKKKPPARR
ncbi:hypothetical protein [Paracoccus tibetensis]|uniref:Uncharacterized protein n=1 Tax=Paracoccus tibetensis TaxID=336292 RepID=A0A1G5HCD5_9RHOB|nr:hypothetical protein [Paracoccus tibetensis]SCY61525.1 hypothetical protein SAMN05660710_02107 [Paracoccus tibetensis]